MKNLLVLLIGSFMLCTLNIKAQINLEHTLDSTAIPYFYCINIGNDESKYVFLNQEKNNFSLYNMDMSPYLTNIALPMDDSLVDGFGVIYVSKTLFDCDSTNIEYVYENPYNTQHKFRVFRTDGTLILEVDSANGPYYISGGIYGGAHDFRPIQNTSSGTKLFLQKYDGNSVPQILIYGLCDSLPSNLYDFSNPDDFFVRISPNPAAKQLNFEIALPNNQGEFQIAIFDVNGNKQKVETISSYQDKYTLDVSNCSAGSYYYMLSSKGKVYQSGKFVLVK